MSSLLAGLGLSYGTGGCTAAWRGCCWSAGPGSGCCTLRPRRPVLGAGRGRPARRTLGPSRCRTCREPAGLVLGAGTGTFSGRPAGRSLAGGTARGRLARLHVRTSCARASITRGSGGHRKSRRVRSGRDRRRRPLRAIVRRRAGPRHGARTRRLRGPRMRRGLWCPRLRRRRLGSGPPGTRLPAAGAHGRTSVSGGRLRRRPGSAVGGPFASGPRR